MNIFKFLIINVLLGVLTFFFLQFAHAQNLQLDNCGIDNEVLLNECEAAYFNEILKEQRGTFDFEGKRLAFRDGNWGTGRSSKKRYFEVYGKPRYEQNSSIANQLIVLTEAEKTLQPDYDAIIVSWSKMGIQNKRRLKLIKSINKTQNNIK